MNINNASALGATASGTTVVATVAGMGLQVQGGITLVEPLTINGVAVAAGALNNLAGSNIWSGPITLAGSSNIGTAVATDTLTVSGTITGGGTRRFLRRFEGWTWAFGGGKANPGSDVCAGQGFRRP